GYLVGTVTGSWIVGALAATAAIGVFGLLIYHGLIRRFQHDDMRVALITLGVAIVGTDLMMAGFGGVATQVPADRSLRTGVDLPVIGSYQLLRLLILGIAIVVGVAL